jgi:lysophospholipase L1-like esterase
LVAGPAIAIVAALETQDGREPQWIAKGLPMICAGDVLLFQGDSITDTGRNRGIEGPNRLDAMGRGYAFISACRVLARQPDRGLRIFNRGVSGDRIIDLPSRWDRDCLSLQPTVLNLLVGVNDGSKCHRQDVPEEGVPTEDFGRVYRQLLKQTRAALPDTRLVICEPFAIEPAWITPAAREDLVVRQRMVRQLADDFGATFIGFQAVFNDACRQAPPAYWSEDGVHPTLAGHGLMARAWLAAVGEDGAAPA